MVVVVAMVVVVMRVLKVIVCVVVVMMMPVATVPTPQAKPVPQVLSVIVSRLSARTLQLRLDVRWNLLGLWRRRGVHAGDERGDGVCHGSRLTNMHAALFECHRFCPGCGGNKRDFDLCRPRESRGS